MCDIWNRSLMRQSDSPSEKLHNCVKDIKHKVFIKLSYKGSFGTTSNTTFDSRSVVHYDEFTGQIIKAQGLCCTCAFSIIFLQGFCSQLHFNLIEEREIWNSVHIYNWPGTGDYSIHSRTKNECFYTRGVTQHQLDVPVSLELSSKISIFYLT